MEQIVKIFRALADRNRLRILKILEKKSFCVCEITNIIQLSTSTVSSHLNILRSSGLIVDHKDGKWVNYSLNRATSDPRIQVFLSILTLLLNDDPEIRQDLQKAEIVDRKLICSSQPAREKNHGLET